MRNLLKASLFRLMKSNGARIAFGLSAVAAAAYYALGHMVSTGRLLTEQAGSVTGLGDAMVIGLFGSLMVGIIIGSEVTVFGFFFGMLTAILAALASKVEIFDNVYKMTPYAYTLSKINMNATDTDLLLGIVVSILFTGIIGLLSWRLFRRAEIK